MTKPNPLKRVTLSRQTLYKYRSMPDSTGEGPEWLLGQIRQEIEILEGIAREVPKSAESIELLIEAWREFAEAQKMRAPLGQHLRFDAPKLILRRFGKVRSIA